MASKEVSISLDEVRLAGELVLPPRALGLVLFAHGSGSSRHSPRNQYVAERLQATRVGTLLFDLLTADEENLDAYTGHLRFDIPLLTKRLTGATRWALDAVTTRDLNVGYFGSSTGAAAALAAAAGMKELVSAVVSRGGRPDLAGAALEQVTASTLLIVGGRDTSVLTLNEDASERLRCEKALRIIPGASHLFEEPGALESVAGMASDWFADHLQPLARAN